MSRIVRERGSVGRRIWRRRMRKKGDPPGAEPSDAPQQREEPLFPDAYRDPQESAGARGTKARAGFFASMYERLFGAAKPSEPIYMATDPVGEVLAVPRGASRLDAFERALRDATPGQPVHRDLALALFRELSSLAEGAGLDLSLLEGRVEACAQALLSAGEEERAGSLFLRMGARHRAAEVFVKTGAVEALEEAYAQIQWEEGGVKQEARLAFERFESLFAVGMREAALASLERALKLWGDNPVFTEVHQSFLARLGTPHQHLLRAGKQELLLASRWPIVIGRGEEAAVRLASPLLSRAHVQLVREDGGVRVRDLDSKGGTRVDQTPLEGTVALGEQGDIDMGGVVVRYQRHPDAVRLVPAVSPERATWALLDTTVMLPGAGDAAGPDNRIRIDSRGRAVLLQGGQLNGEVVTRDTLLLEGDRVGRHTVARL